MQVPLKPWSAELGGFGQRSAAGVRFSPALMSCSPAAAGSQPLPAPAAHPAAHAMAQPAAWLISGGAGALGLLTAAWLAGAVGGAPASKATTKSSGNSEEPPGSPAAVSAAAGQPDSACHRLRLVLTSRSGRFGAAEGTSLAAQLCAGGGPFVSCCVTLVRCISAAHSCCCQVSAAISEGEPKLNGFERMSV